MDIFSKSIILIPALNERKNLEKLIPAIIKFMPGISVVVVDDNSKDGTLELLEDFKKNNTNIYHLIRVINFGYGKSVIAGLRWVADHNYDYVITMDADFSHDYREIPEILNKLNNADVVFGSRYIKGGGIGNWSIHRKLLSRLANVYIKIILGIKFNDGTTGFVGYNKRAIDKISKFNMNSEGYAFLVESKYKLAKAGYKIIEHPIIFNERREGESKMSSRVIWESIWMPWKLRFKK